MPFVPRPEASLLTPQDLLPARGHTAGASVWPSRARPLLSRLQTCGPMAPSATVPSLEGAPAMPVDRTASLSFLKS